jgi:hypothetical protein
VRVQSTLDPRVYRLGLVPVLLAVVLVAFSPGDAPRPLRADLAPDAFDERRAFDGLRGLATALPERRPGGEGDRRLARRVAGELRAAGFAVSVDRSDGDTIDGGRELETVMGERSGTSDRRIVVLAHRDALGRGAVAELSGTAALLELGRVFGAPRRIRHTLALVSTSGGSGGAEGARRAAELIEGPVDAVLVLGDLAGERVRRPMVVPWSNGLGAAPLRLRRTVEEAVRREADLEPGGTPPLAQARRFAAPGTVGEQGPLVQAGLPAVLLSASGERGPVAGAPVSEERLRGLGRAALASLTALDAVPSLRAGPVADVVTAPAVLPAWAVRLGVGALLLAPLLAAVDALARVRRRREKVAPWVRWLLGLALPALLAAAFARALGLVGLVDAPPAPVPADALGGSSVALGAVALVALLGACFARPALARLVGRGPRDPVAGSAVAGAAVAVLLVHSAVLVELWVRDPYAAALLVPAAHLWTFVLVPERRPRRVIGVVLVGLSLLGALALLASAVAPMDPAAAEAPSALLALVAGGHASPLAWLEASLLLSCALAALLVAWHGRVPRPEEDRRITVRGPVTYAGPGSLGGVESTLRR